MSNIRFLYDNAAIAVGASASASSEVPALPASNVQVPERTLVWRSLIYASDQWWSVDLGSTRSINAVAIANPKLHAGGSLTVAVSTNGSSWTTVGTMPTVDTDTRASALFFNAVSARYVKWTFVNTTAVSDYVEIGYVSVTTCYEPTYNVTVPTDLPLSSRSMLAESPAGQRTATRRPQFSSGRWNWDTLGDADVAALQALFRTCDVDVPLFMVADATRGWQTWLSFLEGGIKRRLGVIDGQYDYELPWVEAV